MEQKKVAYSIQFIDLIQAPLSELLYWRENSQLVKSLDSENAWYLNVLVSYLKSDIGQLHRVLEGHPEGASDLLLAIAELRLKVRLNNYGIEDFRKLLQLLDRSAERLSEKEKLFFGEAYFVLGYASYTIKRFSDSQDYYQKSIEFLTNVGAEKKALKALQNKIASKTCEDPSLRLIPEYHQLYLKARKLKDFSTCGLCQMNISREYQSMGALSSALTHINSALTYFHKDFGTLHFYLALVHRAHLYFQLKKDIQAITDIEKAMTCQFAEVHAAIQVLERIDFQAEGPVITEKVLNPTWTARLKNLLVEKSTEQIFSESESLLLQELAKGPKTKSQLISALFGDLIDFESAENRLKNLISRIRKKDKSLIEFYGREYTLNKRINSQAKGSVR